MRHQESNSPEYDAIAVWRTYMETGDADFLISQAQSYPALLDLSVSALTLLDLAIRHRDVLAVQSLLPIGLGVAPDWGQVALRLAVEDDDCNLALVNVILDQGVAPDVALVNGRNALHLAVMHNDSELARLLIKRGADVNCTTAIDEKVTPLVEAKRRGHTVLVTMLQDAGARVFREDPLGVVSPRC